YSLWVTFLLAILLVAVVILSGNRSAWVITAVELGVLSLFLLRSGAMRWRQLLAGFTILVLSSVLVVSTNEGVQERTVDMIEAVERLDYQSIDKALSQRLEIWQAAVAMLSDNWFNGVGPRGFRYAYANYLENGDKHTANHDEQGRPLMHHAHQLILEVLCETGVVGLLGVLLLCLLLYHRWHHMPGDRLLALSFGAAVAGLLFPINSHLAFYSSYSAQLFWLLLALYFAAQAETQAQGSSQLKRS
ncbi:MAG: O-antigen ligase family protein, partial [Cellvibrionaceae bacterium]|nr:O-antigen ligase family protein [Cellvibrionaceae bacterium]